MATDRSAPPAASRRRDAGATSLLGDGVAGDGVAGELRRSGGREIATGPAIDPMCLGDLPDVTRIAATCFPSPWSLEVFRAELARPFAHHWVLREAPSRSVVAFIATWLLRDELHVLSLATLDSHRNRGHGRRLMERALDFARQRGARYASLEVRPSNRAAQRLYANLGFVATGRRPGFYPDNGEDAIVLLRGPQRG